MSSNNEVLLRLENIRKTYAPQPAPDAEPAPAQPEPQKAPAAPAAPEWSLADPEEAPRRSDDKPA